MIRYALDRPAPPRPGRLDLATALNDEQRRVVLHPGGPMLVIAGAGSGKTRTLTYRVARLLADGVAPERVLLCTFTRRAARDMIERVARLAAVDTRQLWGGTFHHLGARALRLFAPELGLPPTFGILDRDDAQDLIAGALADQGPALRARAFPQPAVLASLFSLATNCNLTLDRAVERRAPRFAGRVADLEQVRRRYAERKARAGLVDFDDLLVLLRHLLRERPELAARFAARFDHVLVDEYQDTNALQAEIVDALAAPHRNLLVVGDDAQAIYSFRGAELRNILEFPARWPDATTFRLERNYRSRPEVLGLANRVLRHNRRQFDKTLHAVREPGTRPVLAELYDAEQQAAFVAQRVLQLAQEENVPLGAIAVLYRAHGHSLELQVELSRRQIAYFVRSGVRFFEQAHIKDVLAYLRASWNVRDELAWTRLLRQWPGAGARTVARVTAFLRERPFSDRAEAHLAEPALLAAVPASARASLAELAALFASLPRDGRPHELLERVVAARYAGYAEEAYADARTRLEDLRQLAEYARRYPDVGALLADLAGTAGLAGEDVGPAEPPEQALVLSTVHQAKGLEWDAVFVLGLSEGRFPSAYTIGDDDALEEERRLFYVAATRARDLLYLCVPRMQDSGEGRVILRPSRFVLELAEPDGPPYERWTVTEADE